MLEEEPSHVSIQGKDLPCPPKGPYSILRLISGYTKRKIEAQASYPWTELQTEIPTATRAELKKIHHC